MSTLHKIRRRATIKRGFFDYINTKRIAVVGNSMSLAEKEYGHDIDSHDVVIRFNKSASLLSTEDVSTSYGKKTDVWAMWSVGAFYREVIDCDDCSPELKKSFFDRHSGIKKIQICENGHRALTNAHVDFTMGRQAFMRTGMVLKRVSNVHAISPSVGLGTLEWLKQSRPKSVSIYGFDFKKTPSYSEIDRFEADIKNQVDVRCKHDFKAEEKYVQMHILTDSRFKLFT